MASDTASRLPFIRAPARHELGDQLAQRVAALREVDDNQPKEQAGDGDVGRLPGG